MRGGRGPVDRSAPFALALLLVLACWIPLIAADCKDRPDDDDPSGAIIPTVGEESDTTQSERGEYPTDGKIIELPGGPSEGPTEKTAMLITLAVLGGCVLVGMVLAVGFSGFFISVRTMGIPGEGSAGYKDGIVDVLKPGGRKRRAGKRKKLRQKLLPHPTDWDINYTEIEMGEQIGSGAFGIVYKGIWRGQIVAVKEIKKKKVSASDLRQFESEAAMMRIRSSPNVIMFYGICRKPLCIVTEYCDNGSVDDLLKTLRFPLPRNTIVSMAFDIAKGMWHLHKEGVIHRDLAARNLLLDSMYRVKIADFGLSRVNRGEKNITHTNGGPLKHMAPECVVNRRYSVHSDVWSYGITILEIITRSEPFPNMDGIQVVVGIVNSTLHPEMPDDCPDILVPILSKCFQRDPNDRILFEDICGALQTDPCLMEPQQDAPENAACEMELDFFQIFGQPNPQSDPETFEYEFYSDEEYQGSQEADSDEEDLSEQLRALDRMPRPALDRMPRLAAQGEDTDGDSKGYDEEDKEDEEDEEVEGDGDT